MKEGGAKATVQRKAAQPTTTTAARQERATPARTGGYDEQQVSNLKAVNRIIRLSLNKKYLLFFRRNLLVVPQNRRAQSLITI